MILGSLRYLLHGLGESATSDRLQPLIYGFAGTGLAVQRVGVVMERKGGSLRKLVQSRESSGGKSLPQLEEPELGPEKHPQQGEEGEEGGWATHNSNRSGGIRGVFLFVLHGPLPVPWLTAGILDWISKTY